MKQKYQYIISVHVPKTAGTSFRHMLYDAFGDGSDIRNLVNPLSRYSIDPDYYERHKIFSLGKYKVVHGHFSPNKYQYVKDAVRIAFLRHPVDNVISIYYYWKTLDRTDSPILNYVRDHKLSILEFASLPKIRWLYSKTYFGCYNMSAIDFLCEFNCYNDQLDRLSELLDIKLNKDICINRTGENNACIKELKEKTLSDSHVRNRLALLLADDISFYEMFT